MKYKFKELVDIPKLQDLTDELYAATSIPSSIITIEGEILTGSGWQRICTDFHRQNPESRLECIESDTKIRAELDQGEPFAIYKCPRGLIDASSPIVIAGEHVANAFSGQVFLAPPDDSTEQFFRDQAARFGFDEKEYLEAFREVPIVTEEKFRAGISFLTKLSQIIADLGLRRLNELKAMEAAQESYATAQALLNASRDSAFLLEMDGTVVTLNDNTAKRLGKTADEMKGKCIYDYLPAEIAEKRKRQLEKAVTNRETVHFEDERAGRSFDHTVYPIIDSHGNAIRVAIFGTDVTENKRAEAALRKSERLFRSVIRFSPVGIAMVDSTGTVFECNEALAKMLGYTVDELKSLNFEKFTHPEDLRKEWELIHQVWSGEKDHYKLEKRYLTKGGKIIWVNVVGSIFKGENEDESFGFALVDDITEHKRAVEALHESEAKFAKAFQSAPLLMTITSVDDGRFLDVNDAFVSLTGYSRDLAIGSTSTEIGFAGSEDRNRMMDILKAEGRVQDLELSVTRADGSEMTCLYSAEIVDIQGHKRLLSTAIDITDRKKAEKALQESEGKFRTLVDQSADMLLLHDMEGNILEVNQASINQYGYSREELLSMKVAHLDPDYSERENGGAFWDRFNLNESYRFEARQKRKDGTIFPVEVTLTKILLGSAHP